MPHSPSRSQPGQDGGVLCLKNDSLFAIQFQKLNISNIGKQEYKDDAS